MTSSIKGSAKLAALLKKTAQKLVKNPKAIHKELKKLALTLPLMALLVEEVRAAQKKVTIDAAAVTGEVFEDETALAEFIDAQNLDAAQYTEIEQELDGVLLAKADQAEEEGGDKAAHIHHREPVIGEDHQFGDGGMSLQSEDRAAALVSQAEEPFVAAGLPIVPLPALGGLLGAAAGVAAGAAVIANGQDGATDSPITAQAEGTNLTTSLKDLQKLGVDFVTPAAGKSTINVALGAGDALGGTAGIPLFGDTNRDGKISAEEDAATSVNLTITSAEQLAEVAALGNLASFGIDSVRIDLADQNLLNALVGDNTLATDLAAIRASGLTIDTIDMGSSAKITEAQAATLVSSGVDLHFAATDDITLEAAAGSTHLTTSLKDLQKLGVDTVSVASAASGADLHVTLGDGAAISLANGALPSFGADSALNVTLDVKSVSQLAEVAALAGTAGVDLAAKGLDNVSLNLADQTQLDALLAANVGSNSTFDQGLSAVRNEGLSVTTIDMGSSAAVHLSDIQASGLVLDGLHFAANDFIEVQAAAGSTHLTTSLKDLQKLGVDSVSLTGSHNIDLGAVDFSVPVLPHFGNGGDVTLNLSSTELGALSASDINKLGIAGIDHLNFGGDVTLTQSQLDAIDVAGLNIASDNNVTLQVAANTNASASVDIAALHTLGVDQIDMASDHAEISQVQAQTLVNANMKFVDSDNVTMNIALNTDDLSLDASKAANLHNAGVDHFHVDAAAVINETYAHLMLDHQLDFVSADDITLGVIGTHIGTSLSDLRKLGVDHVAMSISNDADLNYALNHASALQGQGVDLIDIATDAASVNYAAANALVDANIQFSAEDDITLNISADAAGSADFVNAMGQAQPLQNLGVDHIDFLSDAGWLNDAGATQLINAGIDFAAEDDISLLGTNSSYVAQQAKELSKLGVDHVQITTEETDFEEIKTVAQTLHDAGLATFDVDIYGSTLQTLTTLQTLDSIQNNGVDFNVHLGLNSDIVGFNNINFLAYSSLNPGANTNTTFGQFTQALQEAGIHDYMVEGFSDANSSIAIPDSLAAALQEAGMLHALPKANMALDASYNDTFSTSHLALNTSLSAMAELGVDEIVSAQEVSKLFVELGDNPDVAKIIAGFVDGSVADTAAGGLFGSGKEAGLVMDKTTFDHFNQGDISDLLSKLSSLGFTEIDVLKGATDSQSYHINVVAQTPVLSTVQTLGVSDANALLDVFGTDILDKKIS